MAKSNQKGPSYGELIDLLTKIELASKEDAPALLVSEVRRRFPHVSIGRPDRFFNTVQRLAAPTKPSVLAPPKLCGSPLLSYRKREWIPRIRNPLKVCDAVDFPCELINNYGRLLENVWTQVELCDENPLKWSLKGIPNVDFYQDLCHFMKRWGKAQQASKSKIGHFYIAIDKNLQTKGCRPDNAYRFVQKVVLSKVQRNTRMNYGLQEQEIKFLKSKVEACTQQVERLTSDQIKMKKDNEKMKKELHQVKCAMRDITNLQCTTEKQRDVLQKRANGLKKRYVTKARDYQYLEETFEELEESNFVLSSSLSAIEKEFSVLSTATSVALDAKNMSFCFTTKSREKIYSPAIRKLYYSLLSDQVPPSKICTIIKAVLKCFLPNLDTEHLQLPKERCAGYMRREELSTVSMTHKATSICKAAMTDNLHLNSDGTTLQQVKLGGLAINGMVISVNELPDGTADAVIDDVSKEFSKLREMANLLGLPNADAINWSLVSSSTSDSAATQKRFNKLIEEHKEADIKQFGKTCTNSAFDILENFCAMHLGINLRKAFLSATKEVFESKQETCSSRDYHPADILVHESCKLIGRHGTPEYGSGVLEFPDFLDILITDPTQTEDDLTYYKACRDVTLNRQVGSRYFVTASNASKLFFLKDAVLKFLDYTGKCRGNRLQRDVYAKLKDKKQLVYLKADGLMFFHVYADLMALSKSTILNKSALDMTYHYLELLTFLREIQQHPHAILDVRFQVFRSERRLYGDDSNVNHRLHAKSMPAHKCLSTAEESDKDLLYPLIVSGAAGMETKLCEYAKDYLPGGLYWNPDPHIKDIMTRLKPTNDLCESLLGLNDYLSHAIPNMDQMTRSNMIQVKKNKTIKWLKDLPSLEQDKVVELAVARRAEVSKEKKEEDLRNSKQRTEKLKQAHSKKLVLEKRAQQEKEKLLSLHLITTSVELFEAINDIDQLSASTSKKKQEKLSLLRNQINVWKKVLKRKIAIPFTKSRSQRPVNEIMQDLAKYIDASNLPAIVISLAMEPRKFIGKQVQHKFEHEDTHEPKWYLGSIVGYDSTTKLFEIAYDEEGDDTCNFDIIPDLILGDLIILQST